jgi:hypothetical protein
MRALLFVIGLFLATPSWAADATTTTNSSRATDSHLSAALDLIDANRSLDNISAMVDTMAPIQAMAIKRQNPDLSAAQIAQLQSTIKSEMLARMDELKLIIARAYAAHFSEDELHTLAAFYRSDTGKKYVTAVPAMLKEVAPAEAAWAIQVAQDAARKFAEKPNDSKDHT